MGDRWLRLASAAALRRAAAAAAGCVSGPRSACCTQPLRCDLFPPAPPLYAAPCALPAITPLTGPSRWQPPRSRRQPAAAAAAAAAAMADAGRAGSSGGSSDAAEPPQAAAAPAGQPRTLSIVHFNDVYNIEAAPKEPVGGAARFVAKVCAPEPCNTPTLRCAMLRQLLHTPLYAQSRPPALRLCHKQVKSLAPLNPLVLFSGDAFNPSLMSATITMGKQMPPVLNAARVAAACVGNHDLGE